MSRKMAARLSSNVLTGMFYTNEWNFETKKYLPVKYCPLQFEFELASTATDVLSIGGTHESTDFVISNVQLKCDFSYTRFKP